MAVIVEIPYKFPSLNQYIYECRKNRYAGAHMKSQIEDDIGWHIESLPEFRHPVKIHFLWVEKNRKRDWDNVCYAKKFILDAMVKHHKLMNDNRRHVTSFTDEFAEGDDHKVILTIEEIS